MVTAKARTLFECSWEVCNKVGGIYTVVSSKAAHMLKYYKEYFLVGPYFKERAEPEFQEQEPPKELQNIFYELSAETGIVCHYGFWLIDGEPKVILLEFNSIKYRTNYLKKYFWENFQIESLHSSWEFEEPMLWSYAIGLLIDKYQKKTGRQSVIAHFHEWMSGFGLLHLKLVNPLVKTIFTTHATMLGRSLASRGIDIYSNLKEINSYDEARRVGIIDKFTAERACAQNSHVFTTVSEITGKEAEHILGRKPEVLVLNGFNADDFPTIEETSMMHIRARKKIREYLTYHFFPYYPIDLKHNLIFSTFGRPEIKNKGTDTFIKALGKLNRDMKENPIRNRTISVFFWPLQDNNGPKMGLLKDKNHFKHIKDAIAQNSDTIFEDILYDVMYNRKINIDTSLSKKFLLNMRKNRFSLKRDGKPILCSYNIGDEKNNEIINLLLSEGLDNSKENPVKVILYPTSLSSNDLLLNLDLYDAIAGCHFTILPSYYEPWGYTPLESIAVGVPTVTSDLSGFGKFMNKKMLNNKNIIGTEKSGIKKHEKSDGVFILERYKKTEEEVVENLFHIMKQFASLRHTERVKNKINAKELSFSADWKFLVENYINAHNISLEK